MSMFADIAFPISSYTIFTYSIPHEFRDQIDIGSRVTAPLGKRRTTGIIVGFPQKPVFTGVIKNITALVDPYPVLDESLWKLIQWMSAYYFTPIGQVAKTVLPAQLSMKYSPSKKWMAEAFPESGSDDLVSSAPAQKRIIDFLHKNKSMIPVSALKHLASDPMQVCRALEKKQFIRLTAVESIPDITGFTFDPIEKKVSFSESQQSVLDELIPKIQKQKFISSLLHGVTGSGKTEIYIEAVRQCMELKKSAIILLPEISLTPQIAGRFSAVFGDKVALWHSKMTPGIRVWTWKKICSGECNIVIGARSAVFTPVKNLGLIIVDEEQESAYKQESPAPRYHARDVALMRGKLHKAVVVLASATPSLESYYNKALGKHTPLSLPDRFGGAYYPQVHLVDMKEEKDETGKPDQLLSSILLRKIHGRLNASEQVILLQNRRGYSPVMRCLDCGLILECPHCKLPLTYHKTGLKLKCHCCRFVKPGIPDVCPDCQSDKLHLFGTGTQKAEEFLGKAFPGANIARIDTDTARGNHSLTSKLKKFANKELDILIGTQMIAKGLDFENVTLVGVINADTGLYLPDFRAGERVFQLIYQAAGRAGRHKKPGEVIIQSYQPDNPVIKCASSLDLKKYYNIALSERKTLNYPPFSWMCRVEFSGKSRENVDSVSRETTKKLIPAYPGLKVLGPAPCYRGKIGLRYREQLIFKSSKEKDPNGRKLHQYLNKNFPQERLEKKLSVRIHLDINPVSML
ncbi:MAG: primosomal protein N' [Candidatus Marinimicrobia bacterium]|nr:primosomal protein N' [Candidatus Neomarinimicrobiota bacterium]